MGAVYLKLFTFPMSIQNPSPCLITNKNTIGHTNRGLRGNWKILKGFHHAFRVAPPEHSCGRTIDRRDY